jgi:hypothetical protein
MNSGLTQVKTSTGLKFISQWGPSPQIRFSAPLLPSSGYTDCYIHYLIAYDYHVGAGMKD